MDRVEVFEHHYTVNELAELWHVGDDTIRRLFKHEPGVIEIKMQKPGRRRYASLRIPESVALRVYRRFLVDSQAAGFVRR